MSNQIGRGGLQGAADPALELRSVGRNYGALAAVRDVSLAVGRGEIICLLGSSGCGKSTLLRLIAGLETPDAGSIVMAGATLSGAGSFVPPERRGVGLVFQDYALFPHLSVLDNVAFGLRGAKPDRMSAARAALARVRLEARADSYPHMLSGGEQQRVALARALAPQPQLLLMDEPFSNLDRGLRDRVRSETLAILREAGITAIIVTHDPEEALRIADRIVLMRQGTVEQDASPEALYRHPASLYAARFFSELIELRGQCAGGQITSPLGQFTAPQLPDGQAACVALRPHDLQPAASGVLARLLDRTFLGPVQQLRLAVGGLTDPLVLQVHEPCSVQPGEPLFLNVDRRAALVFPAN
jgi:iron(III) transport system ATP-binding protein